MTAINGQVQTELGLDVTLANTALQNVGNVAGLTTLVDVQNTLANLNTLNGVLNTDVVNAINGQVQVELGIDLSTANVALQNLGNVAGLTTLVDVQNTLANLNTLNGVLNTDVVNAINGQVQVELGIDVIQANTALNNIGNVSGLTTLADVQSTLANLNTLNGVLNTDVVNANKRSGSDRIRNRRIVSEYRIKQYRQRSWFNDVDRCSDYVGEFEYVERRIKYGCSECDKWTGSN